MTTAKAPVRDYMSKLPAEVDRSTSLVDAERVMKDQGIHHLPVMSGYHVFGMLSLHDVLRARLGTDAATRSVEDCCTREVVTAEATTPIREVAARMLAGHVGSVVVMDGDIAVGIFTTTDALRVLADL